MQCLLCMLNMIIFFYQYKDTQKICRLPGGGMYPLGYAEPALQDKLFRPPAAVFMDHSGLKLSHEQHVDLAQKVRGPTKTLLYTG